MKAEARKISQNVGVQLNSKQELQIVQGGKPSKAKVEEIKSPERETLDMTQQFGDEQLEKYLKGKETTDQHQIGSKS